LTENKKQQNAGEKGAYEIKTVTASELLLFYSQTSKAQTQGTRPFVSDDERDAKLGCIGHLRADYGRRGNEFWTTWFDHCGELKTQAFKDELDMVINHLRGDGNILNSLGTLSEYCCSHPEAKLDVMHRDDIYGFRIDTDDHCYYIRGMLTQGDYNLYVYCYERSILEQHLAAPRSWEKTEQHEQEAREPEPQTLTADRKAELFDGLVESVNGLMSDDSWYDIFRGIGMTDAEMKSMGLDLPELKVTGHTVEAMAEYVIDQIKKEDMGATQTHITIPIADLTARFKLDLEESGLAEDAFMEELFSRSEVDDAEILSGELWIKPNEQVLSRGDPQIAMGNM